VKTICRNVFTSLVIGVAALMPMKAFAQSPPEPAVVVSVANITEQLADAKYLVDAAGFGQMAFLINVQADQFLKGVHSEKAAGILLYFDEETPQPNWLGFIPVKNMSDVLNTISNNLGQVEEGDDFATIITDNDQEILVKEANGYAFLSDTATMFESIPEDPQSLLGDLPSTYNMSAKVFGQRIPESLREQAIDMIKEGYEAQLAQMENSGEDFAGGLQQGNLDIQMKQLESMIQETDSLVLGFAADKESKSMYFDIEMTGLDGSTFAKRCEATANGKPTRFSGFVNEDSAFNMNSCFTILPEDAENYKKMISQLREQGIEELEVDGDISDEDLEKVEQAADELIEVIEQTLDEGVLDSGIIAKVKRGDVNLAMGSQVVNPGKIEKLVKDNISIVKDELGDDLQIKFNSGSHQGVTLHTLVFTVPEDEEELIANLGEEVTVILGIGEKSIYLAVGNNPLATLKEAMDNSAAGTNKSHVAMQWNIYLAPIMKFAAGIENNEMVEMMAEKLEEAGNDRLGLTSSMTKNGMKMRFDAQDGVLRLIQAATQAMGRGFAPDESDF